MEKPVQKVKASKWMFSTNTYVSNELKDPSYNHGNHEY